MFNHTELLQRLGQDRLNALHREAECARTLRGLLRRGLTLRLAGWHLHRIPRASRHLRQA